MREKWNRCREHRESSSGGVRRIPAACDLPELRLVLKEHSRLARESDCGGIEGAVAVEFGDAATCRSCTSADLTGRISKSLRAERSLSSQPRDWGNAQQNRESKRERLHGSPVDFLDE